MNKTQGDIFVTESLPFCFKSIILNWLMPIIDDLETGNSGINYNPHPHPVWYQQQLPVN